MVIRPVWICMQFDFLYLKFALTNCSEYTFRELRDLDEHLSEQKIPPSVKIFHTFDFVHKVHKLSQSLISLISM